MHGPQKDFSGENDETVRKHCSHALSRLNSSNSLLRTVAAIAMAFKAQGPALNGTLNIVLSSPAKHCSANGFPTTHVRPRLHSVCQAKGKRALSCVSAGACSLARKQVLPLIHGSKEQ